MYAGRQHDRDIREIEIFMIEGAYQPRKPDLYGWNNTSLSELAQNALPSPTPDFDLFNTY
jgi:hypothetical protein